MSLYKREDFIGISGKTLGTSLFLEFSYMDTERVLFTCKDIDHKGYRSFPQLYLSYTEDDPTEWTLATEVFTSWVIWEKISKMHQIRDVVAELRKQNAIRMKSKAIKQIVAEAKDETGKNAFMASKYLLDKNLADPSLKKKQTQAEKTRESSAALKLIEKDAEILKLKVVK
ncbi:MAG: hypothetical protein JKY50_00035 [Oleispira sp.]|nr:hypothetical protein [Oleispira sp.]